MEDDSYENFLYLIEKGYLQEYIIKKCWKKGNLSLKETKREIAALKKNKSSITDIGMVLKKLRINDV
ncbi:hypothetical protein [Entomomonas asaccharolytica]|uniref:Uncharacterized protein n=1 Tax=Entomomonas asaccharolytica TaxID=2785331 RepID=A0A974RZC3_9GAMM|nr:hypothetical protein [Entomomonas asaccharolytica]QQP86929.1 hypothetical protein JHT90_06705 [Entomomonas asaccharolytica]